MRFRDGRPDLSAGVKDSAFRDRHVFDPLNARPNVNPRSLGQRYLTTTVLDSALKPPPLVLRIDWLHEGDAHRLAALGTGIAGRGGLARCRWFGVGQCGLSSQPRFEECGNRREKPSTKGGARIDVLRCKFAALPQIEVSDGCKLATLADYRTKSWVPS